MARPLSSPDVAAFPAGVSWDIILNPSDPIAIKKQIINQDFQVIDIDMFDTDAATIGDFNATKQVICYFSAGSKEAWRTDSADFKYSDTGKELDGWPDEVWVNVKSQNVRYIMKKRIQLAASKGCTAIDPDNVDGYNENQDGFGYDKSAYVDYVKYLAQEATNNKLAIGLKNAVELITNLVDVVQFAVNEQCHQYKECGSYKSFTDANKAVFNIEYGGDSCDSPARVKLSTLIKSNDQSLDLLGSACPDQSQGMPSNLVNTVLSTPTPTKRTSLPTQTSSSDQDAPLTQADSQPTSTNSAQPTVALRPSPTSTGQANKSWGN
ncbi:hypothetical protein CC78DRAFT_516888 [Lojkania enalia]|uniref:alpha-galactosidase n=1 Tax=Lojkania enalia TaxID=147567 RepID=A0A9P4N8C9_9PLEO|nr:hypothetical protein CC78DRAFT_516888 [Didymosphaeria enalia]